MRFEGPLLPGRRPAAFFDAFLKTIWKSASEVSLSQEELTSRAHKTVDFLKILHTELSTRFDNQNQVQLSSYQIGAAHEIMRQMGLSEQLEPIMKDVDGPRAARLNIMGADFHIPEPRSSAATAPPPPPITQKPDTPSPPASSISQALSTESLPNTPQTQQLLMQIAQALQTVLSPQFATHPSVSAAPVTPLPRMATASQSISPQRQSSQTQYTSSSSNVQPPSISSSPFNVQHFPQQAPSQHFPLQIQSPGGFSQTFNPTTPSFPLHLSVNVAAPGAHPPQNTPTFASAGAEGGVPFSSPFSAMVSQKGQPNDRGAFTTTENAATSPSSADPTSFLSSSAIPAASAATDSSSENSSLRGDIEKRRKTAGHAFVINADKASPLSAEFVFRGKAFTCGFLSFGKSIARGSVPHGEDVCWYLPMSSWCNPSIPARK